MNVLYVEDDPLDADLALRSLRRSAPEIQVTRVSTLKEAIARLDSIRTTIDGGNQEVPEDLRVDVVLTDLKLTDGNGISLIGHLREIGLDLPVVVLTGSGDEQTVATVLRSGAEDYVTKQADYRDILPAVLRSAAARSVAQRMRRAQPLVVLYAETNDDDIRLTRHQLTRQAPHIRLESVSTAEAVRARVQTAPPDVLLLDYDLPGTFATDLIKEFLQVRNLDLPIVLVTGDRNEEIAIKALKLGAADYVLKAGDHYQRLPTLLENAWLRAETARREHRLQDERARLAGIIESGMDAVISVDEQQRIVLFNRAAEKMFRTTFAEVKGQLISRFVPERFRTTHHAEVERFAESGISQRTMGGFHTIFGLRSDGEEFPIEASISQVVINGHKLLTVILRDITERTRAERALRASEERFRELAENIQEVFWIRDYQTGKLAYVSPAFERVYGRSPGDIEQSREVWTSALHPDDRDRVLAEANLAQQALGKFDTEYRIVRPDGAIRWIHDVAFPVRDGGGVVHRIAGVAEDITKRKESEEHHLKVEEQLRQAQKMEAIGQLSAGVAHDFNNLLTVIQMQASVIGLDSSLSSHVSDAAREIQQACSRAANLTRQLLAFSRRQTMVPADHNVNEVVTSMSRMLDRILGDTIDMKLECWPAPLIASCDSGMLEQVLLNLVVNARDALADGGRVSIETAPHSIGAAEAADRPQRRTGEFVRISVSDNGPGIAAEIRTRIFEPFFTTKEVGKGTGLGLATVYGIVDQHKGWIEVDSTVGQGTRFDVFIPRIPGKASTLSGPASATAVGGGNETILVVEDEAPLRKVVTLMLRKLGYDILEAVNGREALSLWEKEKHRVQMLFTDLVMPEGVSGKDLALRCLAEKPDLKVIYSSGYSTALACGDMEVDEGYDFLPKPYDPKRLAATIRRRFDEGHG